MKKPFEKFYRINREIPALYGNYITNGELDGSRFISWLAFIAASKIAMTADDILYLSGVEYCNISASNMNDSLFNDYMNAWDAMTELFFKE